MKSIVFSFWLIQKKGIRLVKGLSIVTFMTQRGPERAFPKKRRPVETF